MTEDIHLADTTKQNKMNYADSDVSSIPNLFEKHIIQENTPEKIEISSIVVDGKVVEKLSDIFENGKYIFDNTEIFPNGENDAYLVTVEGNTSLVGNTTLKKWLGTWESWESFIYADEKMSEQYPYLSKVWDLAYQSYIAAFQARGVDMTTKVPNVEALKRYWYTISTTKNVKKIEISGNNTDGYYIIWKNVENEILASDNYVMIGKMLRGFENAPAYVFAAQNLEQNNNYKYFIAMCPGMEGTKEMPLAVHFHFQFGKSLEDMLLKGELYNSNHYGVKENGRPVYSNLKNNNWYATVIDANASDLADYNVILGMHKVKKWSKLP